MRNCLYASVYLTAVLGFLGVTSVWGQRSPLQPEQDARFAKPVCQLSVVEADAYQGEGSSEDIDSTASCLSLGERNGAWYLVNTLDTGNLCFTIIPDDPNGDFDFAVYNITTANSTDLLADPSLEVSCNFTVNIGGFGCQGLTGADGGGSGPCVAMHRPCIAALPGEAYLIYVSNFEIPTAYTIDFSSSTTRIISNNPPQGIATPADGSFTQIRLRFDKSIACSSISLADFELIGPQNYTIQNISGGECDLGGHHENEFFLTVSPPLNPGQLSLTKLVIRDTITDKCGSFVLRDTLPLATPLSITVNPDEAICAGTPVELSTAFSGITDIRHVWLPGNDTADRLQVAPEQTTTYEVIVLDQGGNIVGTASKLVEVKPSPAPMLGADTAICGNSFQLNPGNVFSSYRWIDGSQGTTLTITQSGLYWVEVEDGTECTRRDSIQVGLFGQPNAQFSSQIEGLRVAFNNQSDDAAQVNWDFGDGTSSTQSEPTHIYSTSGAYTVTLTVQNPCGTDMFVQQVSVGPASRDLAWPEALRLYPNPTRDVVYIDWADARPGRYLVQVVDALGQVVKRGELLGGGRLSLSVGELPVGYYYCQVITPKGTWTRPLLRQP